MKYSIETHVTEDNYLAISLVHYLGDDVALVDGTRCIHAPLGASHAALLASFIASLRTWLPTAPRLTAANLIGVPFRTEAAS